MNTLDKVSAILGYVQKVNDETKIHPGKEKVEILKLFQDLGLSPPPELVEVYQKYNGVDSLDSFFYFESIEEAVETYQFYGEILIRDYPNCRWDINWFPIMNMNGDVTIFLNFETFSLHSVDLELDIVKKIADHYEHFLDAFLYIFESGCYEFDEDAGSFDVSDEDWDKIKAKFEIESAW